MATQITTTGVRTRSSFDPKPLTIGGATAVALATVALGAVLLSGSANRTQSPAQSVAPAAGYAGTGSTQERKSGALAEDVFGSVSVSYAGTGATMVPTHGALAGDGSNWTAPESSTGQPRRGPLP